MGHGNSELTTAELKLCHLIIIEGHTPDSAYQQISRYAGRDNGYARVMLKRPHVQEHIFKLRMGLLEKFRLTRERAVERLEAIAFADVSDYVEWDADGSAAFRASGELTKRQASAIKAINIDKEGRLRMEFHDPLAAMAQISKLMGWLEPDSNLTVNNFVIQAPAVAADAAAFEREAQGFLELTAEPPKE